MTTKKLICYLLLIAVGILFAAPLFWAFATSLKPLEQVYSFEQSVRPEDPHWTNYVHALDKLPFLRFAFNSFLISIVGVLGTVLSTSMAGYAFARLHWRGRSFWFAVLLAVLVIPSHVYLIPHFVLYNHLGWLNTYKPLIVPSYLAVDAFYVFLFRQFFRSIPIALEEAAHLDGATAWQTYRHIMLPLAKPAVVTVITMNFVYHWQDFMTPLIYLTDVEKFPLPLGLRMYRTMEGDWVNYLMAASLLTLIPVGILFLITQRFIIKGMLLTGVKR